MNLIHPASSRYTKQILCLIIFLATFCILGLPFTQWGFKTDDWGNVYHSIIRDWQGLLNFFTEGNSERFCNPANELAPEQAFFQGLYRPMSFVYYFIQYCIFGVNPYGFFLVSNLFHALNASLLFLLFCNVASLTASFLAALFFAFHPSLWNWIGWTSAQTYFIELFVLLLIIFALQKYITTHKFGYYIAACILFCANLFLKEQTIILPLWLFIASHLYFSYHKKENPLIESLKIASGFFLVTIGYVVARLHFFPMTAATGTLTFEPTLQSFVTRISSRFYDFVTYFNDALALSWLGQGNPLLKGSIMLVIFAVMAWLFVYNTRKKFVIFSAISMALFSWPALLMHYQPRYLYLALPWTLAIWLILIEFYEPSEKVSRNIRQFFITACMLLISFNACFLAKSLQERQSILHIITTAFQDLVTDTRTLNRNICFLALPQRWFQQGSTQAVLMLSRDDTKQVYQFNAPINPIDGAAMPENYVVITRPDKNHFICTSTNPNALWFTTQTQEKTDTSTIIIQDRWLEGNPLFVAWDYVHQKFRILDL